LDGQKFTALKPGPYTELNPTWFWSRHKEFIRPYKKRSIKPEKQAYLERIKEIEINLIVDEKEISNQATSLSENESMKKYLDLNKKAWDLAEELIK
jgi:hypothetical protein